MSLTLGSGDSPSLLRPDRAILVVVDVQSRLAPAIDNGPMAVARCQVLIRAARRLNVPVVVTEENPTGLGRTLNDVAALIPADAVYVKMAFNAAAEPEFIRRIADLGRPQAVLCGMEAHVCVLQTAFGLQASGIHVFVVADAIGARRPGDRAAALARMASGGIRVVTSEMVVFEWTGTAKNSAFRDMLKLVK